MNKETWEIHFYPYTSGNWNNYVSETPLVTIKAPVIKLRDVQETLSIGIERVMLDEGIMYIQWENYRAEMAVKLDSHKEILSKIDQALSGPSLNDYFQSALYLHEKGIDLEKALSYIREVTDHPKARFFHLYREAAILKDLGRENEMRKAAQVAMESARQAGNDDFVRLNQKLLQE